MRTSRPRRWRALEIGPAVYAEYGDEVAKPRLATRLRREKYSVTGSRVGFVGVLDVYIPTSGGFRSVDGYTYWHDAYWEPEQYWEWQDGIWRDPPTGTVNVREPEEVTSPPRGE